MTIQNPDKREISRCFFGGAILGAAVFLCVYGVLVLNPLNDSFLLRGGDGTQHYVGWRIFRDSPWTFPVGLTDRYCWPQPVSMMYADVIPMLALFFKLFRDFLPETFHYFGLWALLSYVLQGGFSAVLLRRFIKSPILCVLLSLFFSVNIVMFKRVLAHGALGAQWIITLSLILLFYHDRVRSKRDSYLICAGLGILCVFVHGYFVPMAGLILFAFLYCRWWAVGDRRCALGGGGTYCVSVLLSMYVLGAFSSGLEFGKGALGTYSVNLLHFVNPAGRSLFFDGFEMLPKSYQGTAGYLGISLIVISLISLYGFFRNRDSENLNISTRAGLVLFFLFFFLAAYPDIHFGNHTIVSLPMPDFIRKTLGVFRANGRFIWVSKYLLILFALSGIVKYLGTSKKGIFILLCFTLLHIFEFSGVMVSKHHQFAYPARERDMVTNGYEALDTALQGKKRLVLPGEDFFHKPIRKLKNTFSYYAAKHRIPETNCSLARLPHKSLEKEYEKNLKLLRAGKSEKDVLYVLPNKKTALRSKKLYLYKIKDIIIGSREKIPGFRVWKKV